jgi:Esterase-like activity of phytase
MQRHPASSALPSLGTVRFRRLLAVACGGVLVTGLVSVQTLAQTFGPPAPGEPILTTLQIPNLPLGVVTFPNGKAMNLTVALGSGAFRAPFEAPGKLWLLTDRGPAIPCAEAKRLIGMEPEAACGGAKEGSIYPLPGFVPSIYGVEIGADSSARITTVLPLKGKSGRPVSGRSTVMSTGPKAEAIFTVDGKPLPPDPSGIDPEALVRLSDGSFWLADEFGPSLIEVGQDGTIRRRLVPANAATDFKDADYEITPVLPPILRMRRPGHGFRALALSPDEQFLYVMMRTPLSVPDEATTRNARAMRLFKIERTSGIVVGQYFYALDSVVRAASDADPRERSQADVKVAEMVATGPDRLLILEQIEKSSRFYHVTLDDAHRVPPEFDNPETAPSLEVFDEMALEQRMLKPLPKTMVLDGDKIAGLSARLEAFAMLSPGELVVINDNDFSIDGARTQMFRITLPFASGRGGEGPAREERPGREEKPREDRPRSSER